MATWGGGTLFHSPSIFLPLLKTEIRLKGWELKFNSHPFSLISIFLYPPYLLSSLLSLFLSYIQRPKQGNMGSALSFHAWVCGSALAVNHFAAFCAKM